MIDKYNICSYRSYLENFLKKKFPKSKYQDIDDVVQNSLIKAIKNQDSWQKNASIKTWLSIIATNMYFDMFRVKYNKYEDVINSNDMFFIFDKKINDFTEEYCSNQCTNQIYDYLFKNVQKDVYLQTFLLYAYDDLEYNEISEIQNIPIGTVKSRIFKARQKLKIKYEEFISQQQV